MLDQLGEAKAPRLASFKNLMLNIGREERELEDAAFVKSLGRGDTRWQAVAVEFDDRMRLAQRTDQRRVGSRRAMMRQLDDVAAAQIPNAQGKGDPQTIGPRGVFSASLAILEPGLDPVALAALTLGFPASALAVVAFPGSLKDASPGSGYLEAFYVPAHH